MRRERFPSCKYLCCQVVCACRLQCVGWMWPEAETPFSPKRSFLLGVFRWLSATLFGYPVTHGQKFADMFTKHKQLGLHCIWACFGEREMSSQSVCCLFASGSGGIAGQTESERLLVWVSHRVQRQRGQWVWGDTRGAKGLSPPAVWPCLWKETAVYGVSTKANSGRGFSESRSLSPGLCQLDIQWRKFVSVVQALKRK